MRVVAATQLTPTVSQRTPNQSVSAPVVVTDPRRRWTVAAAPGVALLLSVALYFTFASSDGRDAEPAAVAPPAVTPVVDEAESEAKPQLAGNDAPPTTPPAASSTQVATDPPVEKKARVATKAAAKPPPAQAKAIAKPAAPPVTKPVPPPKAPDPVPVAPPPKPKKPPKLELQPAE